ncbi:MAG: lipocalin-like domain-containing protein [Candidatus Obscuribacterales bacterium]|nr:lipocalin-like domain-containing protein [Candidatus Obscuribacterales bacterium]
MPMRYSCLTMLLLVLMTAMTAMNGFAQPVDARTFKQALPGYQFQFPRDYASHEDFKTEWWYYTGHLQGDNGQRYGYELTFFRTGVTEAKDGDVHPWKLDNLYLAHFAISDLQKKKFVYFEKLNRGGVGPASAATENFSVTNENWFVEQLGDKTVLRANGGGYSIHLLLDSLKPPVIHGKDGVSQKASCKGCASHYFSQTRLATEGFLYIDKKPIKVSGLSWMDHEFGSNQLTAEQVGWDWYSIQLNNKTECMLYLMRNNHGGIDPNSSGTLIFPDGKTKHLQLADFSVKAIDHWHSAKTGGDYPMGWNVEIPSAKCKLSIRPAFAEQELATGKSTGVTYWEGASKVEGTMNDARVEGDAYVEMTGYSEKFHQNI